MKYQDLTVYWVTRMLAEEVVVWSKISPKPFHVIFMCLNQGCSFPLEGKTYDLEPRQSLIFRADRLTGDVLAQATPMDYQWASFYLPWGDQLPLRPDKTPFDWQEMLFDRLLHAFQREGGQDIATLFWMRALLRAIEEDHNPESLSPSSRARDIIQISIQQIDAHPEQFWSVSDLAARAGYSKTHFRRTFHAITGQSPQQYIIDARMLRAQSLLRETDLSVSQIARDLGYEDVYHFSKQYRQKWGIPPSQDRQRVSEDQ